MNGLLVALLVGAGVWLLLIVLLIALGRGSRARELVRLIPNLLALFRGLIGDPRVPRRSKAWLTLAALWIASPIDLVPEFLPVIGPLDDAIVAALAVRHVVKVTDIGVLREHWKGDSATLEAIVGRQRSGRE